MKVCPVCRYKEHWGKQINLICPNCDEPRLRGRNGLAKKSVEVRQKYQDIKMEKRFKNRIQKGAMK